MVYIDLVTHGSVVIHMPRMPNLLQQQKIPNFLTTCSQLCGGHIAQCIADKTSVHRTKTNPPPPIQLLLVLICLKHE